jgi:CheY-like chemotaxis protein
MPKEWGPRFYRRLTKHKEFKDIPVLVISGLSGRDLSIGKAVGYFAKPFDPNKVLETVRGEIG